MNKLTDWLLGNKNQKIFRADLKYIFNWQTYLWLTDWHTSEYKTLLRSFLYWWKNLLKVVDKKILVIFPSLVHVKEIVYKNEKWISLNFWTEKQVNKSLISIIKLTDWLLGNKNQKIFRADLKYIFNWQPHHWHTSEYKTLLRSFLIDERPWWK